MTDELRLHLADENPDDELPPHRAAEAITIAKDLIRAKGGKPPDMIIVSAAVARTMGLNIPDAPGQPREWIVDVMQKQDPQFAVRLRTRDGFYSARVKWDGCIDLDAHAATELDGSIIRDDNDDYLHICNIDELIDVLTGLRDAGRANYGPDWGK